MNAEQERALLQGKRNLARFFVEAAPVAWFLLLGTLLLGAYAYQEMPKRKDPIIQARIAVAVCAWPGASAEKVEQALTRRIEEKVSQNADVDRVESTSRAGVAIVSVTLRDSLPIDQIARSFDDIDLKLRAIGTLPPGALPIEFQKDFGDTAALMLTVASPGLRPAELLLREQDLRERLQRARASLNSVPAGAALGAKRSALVIGFPAALEPASAQQLLQQLQRETTGTGSARAAVLFEGPGFVALDAAVAGSWEELYGRFTEAHRVTLHPDFWRPFVVSEGGDIAAALRSSAGESYSYRELDDYTEQIARRLRAVSTAAKATRVGMLGERIFLEYSQARLAAAALTPARLQSAIAGRNVHNPGASIETPDKTVTVAASGEFHSASDLTNTLVETAAGGQYLRDLVSVSRDYESPAGFANYLTSRNKSGSFERHRAITVAIQMREGEQIKKFKEEVSEALTDIRRTLPEDLIIERTSDQAEQVESKVSLLMTSLYEAIAIIVLVGLIGFREWRSALLLALSIPITLALTFVMMWILRIDIQQISIAAIILSLGLLVDDPVVAGDAIKHELDAGKSRAVAAWLGPTKLGRAILYATLTNICAYAPFLLMGGDTGHFIYSLPVVLACALVASRLVSMSFIPMLGRILLRPSPTTKAQTTRAAQLYARIVRWAIAHRYVALGLSAIILLAGGVASTRLRPSFFPNDAAKIFYLDIFLPDDAPIRSTTEIAFKADEVVRQVGIAHAGSQAGSGDATRAGAVESVATFVGGGAPRFWYSLGPQQRQPNYAQLVVTVKDERDTVSLIAEVQQALSAQIAGARIDVRQLQNGKPVARPVEVRIYGDDPRTLRQIGTELKESIAVSALGERARDDWGDNALELDLSIDPERATLAGVSNAEVTSALAGGFNGLPMGYLRDGEKIVPIIARLRAEERSSAQDLASLYVLSNRGVQVPIAQVAALTLQSTINRIQHRNQRRVLTVSCFPRRGFLPADTMKAIRPSIEKVAAALPPGYAVEIGGTEENVVKVRKESLLVAMVSMLAILLTLVLQFRHIIKPMIVFAAIPYGVSGALIAIVISGAPFGFTAILGVISLVGVIVSHVIVLFDYIEELREGGVPLETALVLAGTQRMRPVLITVGATVLGLIPLAMHGGPLWEPLCYAQIGGLSLATAVTLVLVPVFYMIVIRDLRWMRWDVAADESETVQLPSFAERLPAEKTVNLGATQAPTVEVRKTTRLSRERDSSKH
jgi:multidrug efflux pump subunit AcrB